MDIELSIIVPVYNVERYLEECLDSIYAVENIKKEVILVNDGSTDGSLEILKRYEKQYPDITVLIDKKNGGQSSARNVGIRVAKGEYISFIDSDDWIDSKKYEEFFREGKKYNLDIMVSAPIFYKDGKKEEKDHFFKLDKKKIYKGREYLKECYKNYIHRVEIWDDIFKREFLIESKILFQENIIHEDELFIPLVLNKALKVKIIDKNFYYYRQRIGSTVNIRGRRNYICCLYVFLKLIFDKGFEEKEFRSYYFWKYQENFARLNILYLKEHFKLLFLPNLTFQDRLWLLKFLRYIKEVKWSIEKEI